MNLDGRKANILNPYCWNAKGAVRHRLLLVYNIFVHLQSRLKTGCSIAWRSQNEAVELGLSVYGTRLLYALRAALAGGRYNDQGDSRRRRSVDMASFSCSLTEASRDNYLTFMIWFGIFLHNRFGVMADGIITELIIDEHTDITQSIFCHTGL